MIQPFLKKTGGNALKTLVVFVLAVGCSIAINILGVGRESVVMVYLLGVLITSVLTGNVFWGIIHSFASMMILNYLFTEPRYTFLIYSGNDIVLLLFFLITAVLSGTVNSRLQQQIVISARNEATTKTLYRIASGFVSLSGKENIIQQGTVFIEDFTGFRSEVSLHDNMPDHQDETIPSVPFSVYPIRNDQIVIGELRVFYGSSKPDSQSILIIQAVATQLAIALDRESLSIEREEIRVAMEREHLRSTLLRSVAHDLRTPLTGLSGAANLLADNYETLSYEERQKLALDMSEEIIWLTNLVENILNMTRIGDGQLLLHKEEEVIDDIVSQALSHISRLLKDRSFTVELPDEVLMVRADGKLLVQVLINLLENAIRHTPDDRQISMIVKKEGSFLEISVCDTGDGIDPTIKEKIFERFITLDRTISDGKRGIGLGLAICKAIVEAHGGRIYARDNVPTGTCMVFTIPLS